MYAMSTRRGDLRVARLCQEATALPPHITDVQFAAVISAHIRWVAKRYREIQNATVRALIAERLGKLTGRDINLG
jgi:hypothetical protein